MPLEPGPIELIDVARYDLRVESPGLEAYELSQGAEVGALDASLTEPIDAMAGHAEALWPELVEAGLDPAVEEIMLHDSMPPDPAIEGAEEAAGEVDQLVTGATAETPSEAFEPVPEPFAAPADAQEWTEEPSPAGVPPGVEIPGITPAPRAPGAVRLLNLTRPGATDFIVGERWRLEITGRPGQLITIEAGRPPAPASVDVLGTLGDDGLYVLQSTMELEHVGTWYEIFRLDGIPAEPVLQFRVEAT